MDNYQTQVIGSDFTIEAAPEARGFTLTDFEKGTIDRIWQEEQAHSFSTLYNGQLLNFLRLEGATLYGEFVDYKFYLAQLREPGLKEVLDLKIVAVSGITTTADKVLFGKRSEQVTQYKNFYELVPSGGIDPEALVGTKVEISKQFEKELWEETGISTTEIRETKPFALLHDLEHDSYEICAEISVNYLMAKETLRPTPEYQKLLWVSKGEVQDFIKRHAQEIVPLSLHLLRTRFH